MPEIKDKADDSTTKKNSQSAIPLPKPKTSHQLQPNIEDEADRELRLGYEALAAVSEPRFTPKSFVLGKKVSLSVDVQPLDPIPPPRLPTTSPIDIPRTISEDRKVHEMRPVALERVESMYSLPLQRSDTAHIHSRPRGNVVTDPNGLRRSVQPRTRHYNVDNREFSFAVESFISAPEALLDLQLCGGLKDMNGLTFGSAYNTMMKEFGAQDPKANLNSMLFTDKYAESHDIKDSSTLTTIGKKYQDFLVWTLTLAANERPDFPVVFPPLPYIRHLSMEGTGQGIQYRDLVMSMDATSVGAQEILRKNTDPTVLPGLLNFLNAIYVDVQLSPKCFSRRSKPVVTSAINMCFDESVNTELLYDQRLIARANLAKVVFETDHIMQYALKQQSYISLARNMKYSENEESRRYKEVLLQVLCQLTLKKQQRHKRIGDHY